jgi:hypothetical protein
VLKKLNSPKINEPIKKWATEPNRTFSKKELQMAKKCSPSLTMKEMQIKTTLRFHLTPVRIAIIENTTREGGRAVAQIMYIHVSKCKNDKIKFKKICVVSHKNCHIGKWNRVKRIDTTPPS